LLIVTRFKIKIFFFSGQENNYFHHLTFQHFILLLKFAFFNIFLMTFDVLTDVFTATEFYWNGNVYSGLFTTLPILAPCFARIVEALASLAKCFQLKIQKKHFYFEKDFLRLQKEIQKLSEIVWHVPFLSTIRYLI